jgi:hypothetical protein
MKCRNIREKLSEYIDGLLSFQEKEVVDEHLKSCRGCSKTLNDLKKTIEHARNLETVEPPAWLAQKIMTKVRAEARPRKSLFQKLFYPLHIKLPIEAVATVLVVGLALYIYRDIVPEVKLAKAPAVEEVAPQVPGQQSALRDAVDKGVAPPVLHSGKVRSEEGLAPEPMKQAESMREAKAPAPAKKLEQTPAAGAIAKDEARQEPGATAPETKLSFIEKKKEEPLTLTVLVKDPEAAVKEIEKTLKELESKAIRIETAEGKRIITALLNSGKVHHLFEKLKLVGEIREKEVDLGGGEGQINIRIEVIENPN